MTLDKKIHQYVWWVLQEIKKESVATRSDKDVRFEPGRDDNLHPEIKEQRRALKFLEKEGVIKIARACYPMDMLALQADVLNLKPIKYFLDILRPRFDKLFKKYENANILQGKFSGNLNKDDFINIRVKNGELSLNKATGLVHYCETVKQFNPISQEFKIILKLVTNKNNQATYADLLNPLSDTGSNRRTLATNIKNIKEGLGILPKRKVRNKDLIENIKKYGYRLIV